MVNLVYIQSKKFKYHVEGERKLLTPASGSKGQSCRMCVNCDNFSIHSLVFFRLSGNFSGCLKILNVIWKLSRLSGNFPDDLETFQVVWKLSRSSEKFPNYLETFKRLINDKYFLPASYLSSRGRLSTVSSPTGVNFL